MVGTSEGFAMVPWDSDRQDRPVLRTKSATAERATEVGEYYTRVPSPEPFVSLEPSLVMMTAQKQGDSEESLPSPSCQSRT